MPKRSLKRNQRESEPITRREALLYAGIAGVSAAAFYRAGLLDLLFKNRYKENEKKGSEKQTESPKIPAHEQWASKIELPSVSYSKEQWSAEQIDGHFLPKGLPKESAEFFYNTFTKFTNESLAELKGITDIEERNKRINYYLSQVFSMAFQEGWQKKKKEKLMAGINRLLIPNGQWLFGIHQAREKHDMYTLYEIGSVGTAEIKTAKTFKRVPVLNLGERRDIVTNPSVKPHSFVGTYWDISDFIVYDEFSEKKVLSEARKYEAHARGGVQPLTIISDKEKLEKLYDVWMAHEGMHAALYHLDPDQDVKATYQIGAVDMGHYQLPVGNFDTVRHMELHELAACGMGLKNAKNMARYVAFFTTGSASQNYKFAEHVLINEILHSPFLNESVRHKFAKISNPEIVELLQNMPNEALHAIGERMAKLGMHLLQKG